MKGRLIRTSIATAALLGAVAVPALGAGSLTLRVQDAIGVPGGPVVVVLRTYASRPIGQGQVDMEAEAPQPGQPSDAVAETQGVQVFSTAEDAVAELFADLDLDPQQIDLQFSSNSASVNEADGPLAAVFLRLSDTVEPGRIFDLRVDAHTTSFIDENGETVQVEPRNGELLIRAPTDPILISAEAEDTVPGGTTRISMATYEPIPLSSGQVGFRYETAIATGAPVVSMDPRHGNATFQASFPEPGLVVVSFQSPDLSLNGVPGELIQLHLPVAHDVPPGTLSPVSIDPDFTYLLDSEGLALPLSFKATVLEITNPAPGSVTNLRLDKEPGGGLLLNWDPDCGSGTVYAIYRGELGQGYGSLAQETGLCDVADTVATVAAGSGTADFYLVVPHVNAREGRYGLRSNGQDRIPASPACYPQSGSYGCEH